MTGSMKPLAILGGEPVRRELLPYGKHTIEDADIEAVVAVLRSDWITTGPKVGEFEEAFAREVGARYAVAYSSGTAALHGAMYAAGLKSGDEAITCPLTFCATSNAVLFQGARPVFADARPGTLCLDPGALERAITPRTHAIVPVHFAGHPADMDPIHQIARARGLTVIEDAAHALGARYRGRPVGSMSDLTTFSFHPVKHIATGEGGMVTTGDEELARRLRRFRSHGIESDARTRQAQGTWHYEMVDLGYNYRLSDVSCALGLSQLSRLRSNLERRREIACRYAGTLGGLKTLELPPVEPGADHAWHLYPVRLVLEALTADRQEIYRALRAEGIGVNVHYMPVHLHPYYRETLDTRAGSFPVAEDAYGRLLSLPMAHGMTDRDVSDTLEAVSRVLDYYQR